MKLLVIHFMNEDNMPLEMIFPFELAIALSTQKLGFNPTFFLHVSSKRFLPSVRPFTLAAPDTFLRSCLVGALFYKKKVVQMRGHS